MDKIKFFFDLGNMALSLIAVILSLIVVMKTEKKLKLSFELFFISLAIIFSASIIEMNKYIEVIFSDQAKWVLIISRFIALIFTVSALAVMAKIVKEELKCEIPDAKQK